MSIIDDVFNNHTNIHLLKEGGQKKVFIADNSANEKVVIKIGTFESLNSLERIKREVEFLKKINNPFYPQTYNFIIELNEKQFVIIEEFINTIPYSEVRSFYNNEEKVIQLLKKIVEGLIIIWKNNIVHRDIKPDNILITPAYLPKIIDLGIARFLDLDSLTLSIGFRGPCTPVYAAPEQLKNQKAIIDQRTDFFLLGIYILELVYGFHPFLGEKVNNHNSIPENILLGAFYKPTTGMGFSLPFCNLITSLLSVQQFKRFRNYKILNNYLTDNWG